MKLLFKEKESTLQHFLSFITKGNVHKELQPTKEQKVQLHVKFDQALQLH